MKVPGLHTSPTTATPPASAPRRRFVQVVGPRLRPLLLAVLVLFSLLAANSAYLGGVTLLEWVRGAAYQDWFYQIMFLVHLGLGVLLIAPFLVFGVVHLKRAWPRPNRRAVKAGLALFACGVAVLVSGILLLRLGVFEIRDPGVRGVSYWAHVAAPLLCVWLFVLHRLAGKAIRWRAGLAIAGLAAVAVAAMVLLQAQDPRAWNLAGPASGERYFYPSLARTASGGFIPAKTLMMDDYCAECHQDIHDQWSHSVHRLSSFNNPAYLFSVRNTRKAALERDGNVQAARFCAGCHDPAPFFSGAFDDPQFDDVNHPTAQAGITCTGCHAITHVNSPRGNADYTIEEPLHYPFAFSENPFLRWLNRQLVKAKPAFHKKTFLKALHKEAEFCGTCHKVHIPKELNAYKWLRGQNHYDTYLLSGVSGHGVASFYYPDKAEPNCNGCHMHLLESQDFGAKRYAAGGALSVHDHLFPSANTAVPRLAGQPDWVTDRHRDFNQGVMRIDLFALRAGGEIDGELIAPLRPGLPVLEPGREYLLETVVRTRKMGHTFTQGTADSNEVWVELTASSDGDVIARSGALDPADGTLDPWAYRCNAYVLDRKGNRIDRRNVEDVFVPLYDHQIPPGAADVVHYRLRVPEGLTEPLTLEARLNYRKLDTTYLRQVQGEGFVRNDLPILTLADDRVTLPVAGDPAVGPQPEQPGDRFPAWQRWNDYGIGLLRKPRNSQLRQAEEAFARVEALGQGDGALNLARVYLADGRLQEAALALARADQGEHPAPPWTATWIGALVDKQNGYPDRAVAGFEAIIDTRFGEARRRGFDFSRDYRVLDALGETLYERARQERGEARRGERERLLRTAAGRFQQALALDPEDLAAHYNLAQVYQALGETERAEQHRRLHATYKPDDNAADFALTEHRRSHPAADHAAEAVVIYDLKPPEAAAQGLGAPLVGD
jgi:tetratricopeptide (TPR) repeat protein